MSQNAKDKDLQEPTQRRGRAGAVAIDALTYAGSAFRRAGFDDPTLVTRWAEIAGDAVAAVAEPIKFQEDADGAVLTLRCEPGAAVFLQHETRALLSRVNLFLGPGRVGRIRLTKGQIYRSPIAPPHPGRDLPPAPPPEPGLSAAIERLGALRQRLKK